MKTVIAFIFFLSISSISFAQSSEVVSQDAKLSVVVKESISAVKKANTTSKMQLKVKKLNHNKSNQIISIKAYRKSLNVKVKTVKLC